MPRLAVDGRLRRAMVRTVLRIGSIGADRRVRREGLQVERLTLEHAGRTLRFRVIRPAGPARGLVLDVHGGAWVFGAPSMDDPPNIAFAKAGALVLSFDYALALPRPIPDLQAECAAAMEWLLTAAEGDVATLPIVVTGESAGAHLVLGAVIAARDRGLPLGRVRGMLLHCGVYDLDGTPSARAAGPDTLVLHGPTLARQIDVLLPDHGPAARRALSPLHADLSRLPPALVVVGDIDPLRDDSIALVGAMEAAGTRAMLAMLPEAPHGTIHLPGRYAAKLRHWCADWVAERLGSTGQWDKTRV